MSRVQWFPSSTADLTCCACNHSSSNAPVLATADEWNGEFLITCPRCGTVSWNERIEADYASATSAGNSWFRLEHGESLDAMVRSLEPLELVVGQQPDIDPVFADVGCGTGLGADYAAFGLGWDSIGYDPSPTAAFSAAQLAAPVRTEFFPGSEQAPANLVMSSEVLEHVVDVDGFLTAVRDGMADSGYLLLTTPPVELIWPTTDEANFFSVLGRGQHLQYFSTNGLSRVLERNGFIPNGIWIDGSRQIVLASKGSAPRVELRIPGQNVNATEQYLRKRWAAGPEVATTRVFGSRLVKLLTHQGRLDEAKNEWNRLSPIYEQLMQRELRPETMVAAADDVRAHGYISAETIPANLAALSYMRGMMLLNSGGAFIESAAWFNASNALATAWMDWYQATDPAAGRDGELVGLTSWAPQHEQIALSYA